MSPRKWAPKTKAIIIDALIARDGPNCVLCHASPTDPLEIDHIDPDGPDSFGNFRLLCKACNLARRRNKDRGINERETEPQRQLTLEEALSATYQAKQNLDYSAGSVEMQANGYYETSYRNWVLQQVPIKKQEAINAGAETVGCSPETTTRYLTKLTSPAGPLRAITTDRGTIMLDHKPAKETTP